MNLPENWVHRYAFDHTGRYTGLVQKNLDSGEFPKNSTTIAPPFPGDPWLPIWNFQSNTWDLLPRGEVQARAELNDSTNKYLKEIAGDLLSQRWTLDEIFRLQGTYDLARIRDQDDLKKMLLHYYEANINDMREIRAYINRPNWLIRLWRYIFG